MTSLAQQTTLEQVGVAVQAKGLDEQKQEGANVLRLIDSAAPTFRDPALGNKIDVQA